MDKRESLKGIEDAFREDILSARGNISKINTKRLSKEIEKVFDLDIDIVVSKNDTKEFYGMTIVPKESKMMQIIDVLVDGGTKNDAIDIIWKDIDEWTLDIDSMLLGMDFKGMTAETLTAIFLHEIGHVVYSNSVPVKLNTVVAYKISSTKGAIKDLIKLPILRKLFTLSIIETCSQKMYSPGLKKEREADKFVVQYGYGEELKYFIDQLVKSQGGRDVLKSDRDIDQEINIITTWTLTNIEQLSKRSDGLKSGLKAEMLRANSNVLRQTLAARYDEIFGIRKNSSTLYLAESKGYIGEAPEDILREQQIYQLADKIVSESIFKFIDKLGRVKPIKQLELDTIAVDIGAIETHSDKLFLLDQVYDIIDQVNVSLDHIHSGHPEKVTQSEKTLLNFRSQLERMREEIMSSRIIDKETGVFIKYPKGYQG